MRLTLAVFMAVFGLALASAQETGPGEHAELIYFKIDPPLFSPGASPNELDRARIHCRLTHSAPVFVRLLTGDTVVRTLSSADFVRETHVPGSHDWNGRSDAGDVLPDGRYEAQLYTSACLNWRSGDVPPRDGRDERKAGVLAHPRALALDAAGNLYVATNERPIQVLDAEGRFLRFLEPKLTEGERRIDTPAAMVMTSGGKLMALAGRDLIEVDPASGATRLVVDNLTGDLGAVWELGLAVDRQGNCLVSSPKHSKIVVYGPKGILVREIGGPGQFTRLSDVTVGPDGVIYAVDAGSVQLFNPDGKLRQRLALTSPAGAGTLTPYPRQIAVRADGSFVLAQQLMGSAVSILAGEQQYPPGVVALFRRMSLLQHYSPQGKLLEQWGTVGSGPGQFCSIVELVAVGDELYVCDRDGNQRIVRMGADGNVLRTIQTRLGLFSHPSGLVCLSGADPARRYAVADLDLDRCTILGADGTATDAWTTWPLGVWQLRGVFTDNAGRLYFHSGNRLLVTDSRGALLETVTLSGAANDPNHAIKGLCVDAEGRVVVSDSEGLGVGDDKPVALRLYGRDGAVVARLATDEQRLLGPLAIGPDGRLRALGRAPDKAGREQAALCELDLTPPALGPPLVLDLSPRDHAMACARDGVLFTNAYGTVGCFDLTGNYQWNLDIKRGYSLPLLTADGDNVVWVNEDHKHPWVESWNLKQELRLGTATVEIDNTLPVARLTEPQGVLTGGDTPVSIRGTATDKNLRDYSLLYREEGAPTWQRITHQPITDAVSTGELGQWRVPQSVRNKGCQVKLVVRDKAGNTSETEGPAVAFDDDNDGMINAVEIAQGTDPEKATPTGCKVAIQLDFEAALRPYFNSAHPHAIPLIVQDVTPGTPPGPLYGGKLRVTVDAGTLQPAAEDGSQALTTSGDGIAQLTWTSPDVDSAYVTVGVEYPAQVVRNRMYDAARSEFTVAAVRDDDEDWLPDTDEDDTTGAGPLRNSPDSDGDGVIDGYDIAPRDSYANDWSRVYNPGMFRYTHDFCFYGIGGEGSKVWKDGDDVGTAGIVQTPEVDDSQKMLAHTNKVVFKRDQDAAHREPFGVVGWQTWDPMATTSSDINTYSYGKGDYKFYYKTALSQGTATVENVDPIDMTKHGNTQFGIHRAYLRSELPPPPNPEHVDRTLTIQWISRQWGEGPREADAQGSYRKPAWMVEAFPTEALQAKDLLYTGVAPGACTHQAERIYEATLEIPGSALPVAATTYLKLTPCWVERNGAPLKCPVCKQMAPAVVDKCPACQADLNRDSLEPGFFEHLVVSGISVDTPVVSAQWVWRLAPREGHPVTEATMAAVIGQVEQSLATGLPANQLSTRSATVDGTTYTVEVVSVYGLPGELTPEGRASRISELGGTIAPRLANADAVLLVASMEREQQALYSAIDWGAAGTWYALSRPAGETLDGNAPLSALATGGAPPPSPAGDQTSWTGAAAAAGKTGIKGYKIYSGVKDVAKWSRFRLTEGWTASTPTSTMWVQPEVAVRIDIYDQVAVNLDKPEAPLHTGQRVVSVTKAPDGQYAVRCEKTKWGVGIKTTDEGKVIRRLKPKRVVKTEVVSDLSESRIINKDLGVGGTPEFRRARLLNDIGTLGETCGALVSNGVQMYACGREGDTFGLVVYALKAEVEATRPLLACTKLGSTAWVKGLQVGKGATRISVVAVAAGALETMYYGHKLYEADTVPEKQEAATNMYAAIADAEIAVIEPWGGIILASWFVSAQATQLFMSKVLGMEVSPLTSRVTSSPGRALSFLVTHWFTDAVPQELIESASRAAAKDLIASVQSYNKNIKRATHIYVAPGSG